MPSSSATSNTSEKRCSSPESILLALEPTSTLTKRGVYELACVSISSVLYTAAVKIY